MSAARARASRPSSPLALVLLAAALLAAGCTFRPKVPSGTVTCEQHSDCPRGFSCLPAGSGQGKLCCAGDSCGAASAPSDARRPDTLAGPDGGNAGADSAVADTGAGETGSSDAGEAGSERDAGPGVQALVSCSPPANPEQPAEPGTQKSCTIVLEEAAVLLNIDRFDEGDPRSIRNVSVCRAELPLAAESSDPATMARRPLGAPTVQKLGDLITHYKELCAPHQARVLAPVAGGWARELPEQASLKSELATRTGLMLEIPTPLEEQQNTYLGVTRNRRRLIVLDPGLPSAEVTFWSRTGQSPVRHPVPISFTAAGNEYFSHPAYTDFEGARRNLRGRLRVDMARTITELSGLVRNGAAETALLVGSADALLPLAVTGRLRSPASGWDEPEVVSKKVMETMVTESMQGPIFGSLTLPQLTMFLGSIDVRQFTQLREQPRRSAYAEQVMVLATVLELLVSELRLQEVAFVSSSDTIGYTLGKLFPGP